MEIILYPVIIVVQLIVHLFMAILGLVYNVIFRADNANLADPETKLKPPNPWFVFFSSLAATLFLGCIVGGLCLWYWGTVNAFWWGLAVFSFMGFFASISALTGEATPMEMLAGQIRTCSTSFTQAIKIGNADRKMQQELMQNRKARLSRCRISASLQNNRQCHSYLSVHCC